MEIQHNQLPKSKQDSLRQWLNLEAFEVLIEVLESQAFEREADSANAYLKSTTGADALAKDFAKEANLIYDQIANLKAIRAMEKFTVATAKPTTKTTP